MNMQTNNKETKTRTELTYKRGLNGEQVREYASCKSCNNGTKAADAAVSFLSRIDPRYDVPQHLVDEGGKLWKILHQIAPEFVAEFRESFLQTEYHAISASNIIRVPMSRTRLNGQVVEKLMGDFGAKLAMALYAEHIGQPLPLDGDIYSAHYFNQGPPERLIDSLTEKLTQYGQLTQGMKKSGKQFEYRYNTDKKSLLFAICSFRGNVWFIIGATADQNFKSVLQGFAGGQFRKPGFVTKI